ncbi:MAG: hypothetical protein C4527_23345 [Candidatus Omnitrophota bacterium]|jgi:sialic acid synthase SpsE|nr:MAG: hypothetical protein C4527_23345 [Candidatus Omnitrophota bacterium]
MNETKESSPYSPCFLIAEIGFNHEGNMDMAEKMIRAAADAGADAVKFQTFRAGDIALPSSPHFELIRKGELDIEQHRHLARIAREQNVDFLSTPYSPWAVDLLETVGVSAYKVASMDSANSCLLAKIAETGKPIFLSTGMTTLSEIDETIHFLHVNNSGPVTLLHCISHYPAKAEDLHLKTIPLLKTLFHLPVGYSDHYPGTQACLAAAMMGASVIETHFTLDRSAEGGDHSHSVDPPLLKKLIEDIELFSRMRGRMDAIYQRPDRECAAVYRRGVYAARDLESGEVLQEKDLVLARPPSDFAPNDLKRLVGKPLRNPVKAFTAISKDSV